MTAPEDSIFDVARLISESQKAVEETNRETKKLLDETKKDFSSRSQFEFKTERKVSNTSVSASTSTDNENWIRLNQGFYIPPVEGKFMAFQAGYKPKTRPFTPSSRPGGPEGPWVYTHKRRGSEVQGRGWIVTVYSLQRGKFYKRVNAAFAAALKG